jgi:hypothetical protein
MRASSKPKSIRVHLSIRPDSSAYEVLIKCDTAAARRSSAQELMQLAASVLLRGMSALRISTVTEPEPGIHQPESARTAFTAEAPSDVDAILGLDFSDL